MKRFKNRKNVKNVNNTVKNNANMDSFEELVNAAKEFKIALDDEVANREYERKKRAKKLVEDPVLDIDDVINAETTSDLKIFTFDPSILSSEPRGRAMTYGELYRQETAKSAMQAIEDAINLVTEEKREKSEFLHKPFWLGREDFLTYKAEKSNKSKPASEVESLKAELENLNAHFKGVCAERDNLSACLKSCEKDLKQKQDEAVIMRQEAVFQFKRAEKAEDLIKQIGEVCDIIKKHIVDYGSKKKSK